MSLLWFLRASMAQVLDETAVFFTFDIVSIRESFWKLLQS